MDGRVSSVQVSGRVVWPCCGRRHLGGGLDSGLDRGFGHYRTCRGCALGTICCEHTQRKREQCTGNERSAGKVTQPRRAMDVVIHDDSVFLTGLKNRPNRSKWVGVHTSVVSYTEKLCRTMRKASHAPYGTGSGINDPDSRFRQPLGRARGLRCQNPRRPAVCPCSFQGRDQTTVCGKAGYPWRPPAPPTAIPRTQCPLPR